VSDDSRRLPRHWTKNRIEELFAPLEDRRTLHQGWSPQCEKEPSPSEDVWGVLKTTSIQAGEFQPEHNKRLPSTLKPRPLIEVKTGDILITCAGPRVRCGVSCLVRRTRKRLMMSGKMYRFRIDERRADARYVEAFLQTEEARLAIEKMKTGSSDSGLNLTHDRFRQLAIPIAPLEVQRRIVAEIEKQFTRLQTGIATLQSIQAKLKRYRAAILKAACEGREWKKVNLGDVVLSMKNGLYKPRSAYADEGVACLRMYNIENGKIVWKNIKRMKLTKKDVDEYHLLEGDLLVNRVNSRELVGKAAPIPEGLELCVFESKNIRVRLNRELADPKFVGFAMAIYGQAHFNRNAQQVVGMASISQPQVAALRIPLPPLAEQRLIVAEAERKFSVVEELQDAVTANLQRAARLRQSTLQNAFTGEL
jgi:type I restriction enzyme S subunit